MKKCLALLLTLLLAAPACAQELPPASEEAHAAVALLFDAAAGTTLETEQKARKGLSREEQQLRSEEQAEYRRTVLPWLLEAFRTETEPADLQTQPVIDLEACFEALAGHPLGQAYLQMARLHGAEDAESCMALTKTWCAQWVREIDAAALRKMNPDYLCWIYAHGTPIDYPVVLGQNNQYYVNHLFDGRRNSSGTLFADHRNLPDFQDPNTLIYGHHMRNQSMFGMLDEYEDQAFYESHPYMLLVLEDQTVIVELFAAYVTNSVDHCYDLALSTQEELLNFAAKAKEKSDFLAQTEVEAGDRLVTLSTCAYAFEDARYVVIGKLLFPADILCDPLMNEAQQYVP